MIFLLYQTAEFLWIKLKKSDFTSFVHESYNILGKMKSDRRNLKVCHRSALPDHRLIRDLPGFLLLTSFW